jgi:hypothetical protein
MRKLVAGVFALAVVSLAGCYEGTSRFRTANGEPAPTYSRMDSVWKPVPVSCGGETFYLVDDAALGAKGMRIRHDTPPEVRGLTAQMFCGLVRGVDARIAED